MNPELLRALTELSAAGHHNRQALLTAAEALALQACMDELRQTTEELERELEKAYRDRPMKVHIIGGENPLQMRRADAPEWLWEN